MTTNDRVYDYIQQSNGVTTVDIREALNISPRQSTNALQQLTRRSVIRYEYQTKGFRKYYAVSFGDIEKQAFIIDQVYEYISNNQGVDAIKIHHAVGITKKQASSAIDTLRRKKIIFYGKAISGQPRCYHTETQQDRVLRFVVDNPRCTTVDIASNMSMSKDVAIAVLSRLRESNYIHGYRAAGKAYVWTALKKVGLQDKWHILLSAQYPIKKELWG
ncbi:hypothetical protein [Photobacterium piscicola]|uniref:hypothetical protein n=1 Tax=Photobacterium piscicola TaxID=1378299 RepID=UPI0037369EDF